LWYHEKKSFRDMIQYGRLFALQITEFSLTPRGAL